MVLGAAKLKFGNFENGCFFARIVLQRFSYGNLTSSKILAFYNTSDGEFFFAVGAFLVPG